MLFCFSVIGRLLANFSFLKNSPFSCQRKHRDEKCVPLGKSGTEHAVFTESLKPELISSPPLWLVLKNNFHPFTGTLQRVPVRGAMPAVPRVTGGCSGPAGPAHR